MHMKSKHPNLLQFDTWTKMPNVINFSTTSQGGVSNGNFASFNLGRYTDDEALNVDVNYRFLAKILGIDPNVLFSPKQSHGNSVCTIDEDFLGQPRDVQLNMLTNVDALVTNVKNVGIGVTTADCVPILLYDPQKEVLAAVHAGWKGTVQHIASKTLTEMRKKFGCQIKNVIVGIAPSISAQRFEVGEEVGEAFSNARYDLERISFRNETTGKLHINLQEANILDMTRGGVKRENIEDSKLCTYSNPDLFFSARRQTIKSGRMMTGGVLI